MGTSKKKNRSKKRAPSKTSDGDETRNFRTLFSVLLSPEGIKPPVLKNFHRLLVSLSSNAHWSYMFDVDSHDFLLEVCHEAITMTFADVCELSNVLFKQLEERFGKLYSTLCNLSANEVVGESSSHLSLFDTVEIVGWLLRCCMVLMTLLEPQQNHVLGKGFILLTIFRKLSLANIVENKHRHALFFHKSVLQECNRWGNGCTTSSSEDFTASFQFLEPHNPLLFFVLTMLEVFTDELAQHTNLRGYFMRINLVASANEKLLIPPYTLSDNGIIMEALCSHFILSFSDKQVFGDFLTRLFWLHTNELIYPFGASSISLTAAVSLLHSPTVRSTPKYMQAHLFSLVSEAADIMMNRKTLKPDRKLFPSFLKFFEETVILYKEHISFMPLDHSSTSARGSAAFNTSPEVVCPSFEHYISSDTKDKIDRLLAKLDQSFNLGLKDNLLGMKSDLVNSSMRFIKECQNVYGISCQDEILAILSCLILKASESFDDAGIQPIESAALQHIYLLASLFKLMSMSLLQAVWCLRHTDDFSCLKTLKDFSSCKEHDFILQTISFFGDLDWSSPLQKVVSNAMSGHSTRHLHSKMMFLHFTGLMSVGFDRGLDCLVKGCLLINHALLNLFVFEEVNLAALQSLVNYGTESFSSSLSVVKFHETIAEQNSSLVVATKFQKIRSLHSGVMEKECKEIGASSLQTSVSTLQMVPVAGPEEETEETCNAEIFLKCILKQGEKISDFDDLANFIECKEGKDYPAWLKNRARYNRKKFEKMAVLRWKRKKKTWRTLSGKKN